MQTLLLTYLQYSTYSARLSNRLILFSFIPRYHLECLTYVADARWQCNLLDDAQQPTKTPSPRLIKGNRPPAATSARGMGSRCRPKANVEGRGRSIIHSILGTAAILAATVTSHMDWLGLLGGQDLEYYCAQRRAVHTQSTVVLWYCGTVVLWYCSKCQQGKEEGGHGRRRDETE